MKCIIETKNILKLHIRLILFFGG